MLGFGLKPYTLLWLLRRRLMALFGFHYRQVPDHITVVQRDRS